MSNNPVIAVCPGTLLPGYNTYSPQCRRAMFDGKKVSHMLPFPSPTQEGAEQRIFFENQKHISISGVQGKYSLLLDGNDLRLTNENERGSYILKPIPSTLMNSGQLPANEHLTMQIATQIFKLSTAKNALIFFSDGKPAYITRRFDINSDGSHCLKEDFAALAQATSQNKGSNFKYNYSYAAMAALIDAYFPASIPAKEQFFRLVVFNYLFSNGDAHLKNFSRIDCEGKGDGSLSPAYDLVTTQLHVDDSDLALTDGLYDHDYDAPSYSKLGYYAFDDFYEFGLKIGLLPNRTKRFIEQLLQKQGNVAAMIARSFLSAEMQGKYLALYKDKHKRLSTSLSGLHSLD